jgi:transcriptional regulator with XRE-family HTH domain
MPALRQVRQQRHLNMLELARAAGVLPSIVFLTERGRVRPEPEMAQRIAAALGVDVETIDEFHGRPRDDYDPLSYSGPEPDDDGGSPAPVPRRPRRPSLAGAAEAPLPAPEHQPSA